MFARALRIVGSFAIVVVAYWVYAHTAVPLIEPPARGRDENRIGPTAEEIEQAGTEAARQRRGFDMWFAPGDWEMGEPMVLDTPQGMVLLQEYENLPGGKIKVFPCSMVFLPTTKQASDENAQRKAIVLRAREGAILQFDEAFDPKRGKIGKMVGGQLIGPVEIFSDQKLPGPEDDLHIETRDVVLDRSVVSTPHPLTFRLGPNSGRGRRLRMTFATKADGQIDTSPQKNGGPNLGGLTSFELAEEVELRIVPGEADMFPGRSRGTTPDVPATAAANAAAPPKPPVPVEVRCQGPFQFDLQQYIATFHDRVDVLRLNPVGPSDQLTCELLTLVFETREKKPTSPLAKGQKQPPKNASLEPSRLVADGDPVVLRAPSNGVEARGQQLEYDLKSGKAKLLHSKGQVDFRQGQNEIHAPSLEYQPEPGGRLGQFLAAGPGWLRGMRPDDPDAREVQARWTRRLHFRPHEKNQVLSVEGEAHVQVAGTGQLDGDEIHLWLKEAAPAPAQPGKPAKSQPQWVADRMLARGQVRIDSAQLTGTVGQMEIWFEHAEPAPGQKPAPAIGNWQPADAPLALVPRTVLANVMLPAPQPVASLQKFHVVGELLRMKVTLRGQAAEANEVIVERDVRFVETVTTRPGEQPLLLTGDQVHVLQPTPGAAEVTVTGRPAHVEARGLTLDGSAIHLDRAKNRLWVDGRGVMTLPANQAGDPLAGFGQPAGAGAAKQNDGKPRTLEVAWQGGMNFDGLSAAFDRDVVARMEEQLLRTDNLEVVLARRIQFDTNPAGVRPEVELLNCRNRVFLENRTLESGRPISIDRLQVGNLQINQRTGEVLGQGPGWMTSVRFGAQPGLMPAGPAPQPRAAPANADQLNYLGVQFQRALTGNLRRREMNFEDQVRTVYGPIPHWQATLDPDKPEEVGERGMVMSCDRLTVADTGADATGRRVYELLAQGNTLVEGSTFTARATRLAYAQAKELLVLEGDGRNKARLYRQTRVGGQTSEVAAGKILYWRGTNRVEVDDADFLDLSELNAPAPRR